MCYLEVLMKDSVLKKAEIQHIKKNQFSVVTIFKTINTKYKFVLVRSELYLAETDI